jgi:chemotaxis protein CheZ
MIAMGVAVQVREALARLNQTDLKDPRLTEVLDLSQQLVDALQAFLDAPDKTAHGEFRYIATYIARTRQEISVLRPHDIREERIPAAGAELEAIVKHTEAATHAIMEAAETIMNADPTDMRAYKALVGDKVMEIFQACSFQDITGQRVQKIVDTLKHIESRVARFAHAMGVEDAPGDDEDPRETRKKALLLHGPALNGPEVKQDEIDRLFDTPASPASQEEIDRLFS